MAVGAEDGGGPGLGRSAVELLALTGLAITQPVLDVFGRAPDLFIHRQASRVDIVAFALLVAVLPALVLWSIEYVVRRISPAPAPGYTSPSSAAWRSCSGCSFSSRPT